MAKKKSTKKSIKKGQRQILQAKNRAPKQKARQQLESYNIPADGYS